MPYFVDGQHNKDVLGGHFKVDLNSVHLVRVTTRDNKHRLWVAATSRE